MSGLDIKQKVVLITPQRHAFRLLSHPHFCPYMWRAYPY